MCDPEPVAQAPYTPGKMFQSLASEAGSSKASFIYPTYGKQGGKCKAPPFKPTSVTVETIDAASAYNYQHGHLLHSFEKTASSPRRDDKVPQQNTNEMNFTGGEVRALTDELKTRDGAFHMKRLVSPSLKRIEKALTELLTRVMARGEALGNSEKALSRSFQVFSGRGQDKTSCEEFARKLSGLSLSWSSFTADECLALALSLNCNEEALEQGVVTFEDFKRFALEKCGEKDKKGRRTVSENNSLNGGNGMIDESEIAHGFYDDENDPQHDMYGVDGGKSALDLDTSIVSNIVKTNNAIVPPKSFLEEKFQHLCKTAREQCGTDVWGRLDSIADICLIKLVGGDPNKAKAIRGKAKADDSQLSEDAMKQIAKDCVKLRKELAKKEAQVKRMNRDNDTTTAPDTEVAKPKGTPAANTNKPISSIPGTNRFYFSRTPGATARKHSSGQNSTQGPGSEKPTGMKKQFTNNPTLQRSSVQVMYAAMGLPDEEERFDTPKSSVSDSSMYLFMGGGNGNDNGNGNSSKPSNPQHQTPRNDPRRELSFSTSAKGGGVSEYQKKILNRTSHPHLGYIRNKTHAKPKPSLDIFKSSRCSTKGGGKNVFENRQQGVSSGGQGHWVRKKGEKTVKTAATTLFNSRFTDTSTSMWAKDVYRCFGE
ncbi:hypothetical protein TL16_g02529 [Triparma laevis f. inornata]|uniref:Uncharacterized protein n=1 Tax=Triparma laevis f. inornata TaxID=1714386 RepID=A0A9W6ZVV7_9STRA|nr:hypothetical protein TL16_g02529 [Triparma laevis f. inornata]